MRANSPSWDGTRLVSNYTNITKGFPATSQDGVDDNKRNVCKQDGLPSQYSKTFEIYYDTEHREKDDG